MNTRITTVQARVGAGQEIWFSYVDGKMLRAKNGVGRRFKTKEAAEAAARAIMPGNGETR